MNIFFNNIQSKIADQIASSNSKIQVAVAWFTNKELLSYLTEKVKLNISVQILISDDVINKRLSFDEFVREGGELLILSGDKFLHEKFSIFDSKKVIVGSYNWTYGAEYKNHESIIASDHENLIKSYSIRFRKLWEMAENAKIITLQSHHSNGFIQQEEELKLLERELDDEVLETLKEVKRLKIPIRSELVLDMIERYGVIGACRKVLEKGNDDANIPSGFFKLAEANRLDQTFEYLMTKPKYRVLFPDKILELAEERLKKFSR